MDTALAALTEQIRAAAADGRGLRLRGGGSKDFYGQALDGEVLDTRGLAGIVDHEPSELVVTVRAGTPLADLQAVLAAHGQVLAFEPPLFDGAATVGGMVAAGLAGPARVSAGGVRDHVLGLHLIDGRARQLVFGGTVMKNVAGYDVSRLMVGALGTLGLITRVSLKVLPRAPREATLRFELAQADALRQLQRWCGQPLPLNASCWVQDEGRPSLFVRLRGAAAAVDAACRQMLGEAGGERLDASAVAKDWQACADQTLPFFRAPPSPDACLWRLSVAPAAPPVLGWPQLVEWHGGLRWLWAPAAEATRLRALAAAARGHATLFRVAAAADRRAGVFTPPAPASARIQQALKREFDPAGIFNPGRLFPES